MTILGIKLEQYITVIIPTSYVLKNKKKQRKQRVTISSRIKWGVRDIKCAKIKEKQTHFINHNCSFIVVLQMFLVFWI